MWKKVTIERECQCCGVKTKRYVKAIEKNKGEGEGETKYCNVIERKIERKAEKDKKILLGFICKNCYYAFYTLVKPNNTNDGDYTEAGIHFDQEWEEGENFMDYIAIPFDTCELEKEALMLHYKIFEYKFNLDLVREISEDIIIGELKGDILKAIKNTADKETIQEVINIINIWNTSNQKQFHNIVAEEAIYNENDRGKYIKKMHKASEKNYSTPIEKEILAEKEKGDHE